MKAVDAGNLSGSAHLTVDLNGFPRGTKTFHGLDQRGPSCSGDEILVRLRRMVSCSRFVSLVTGRK